MFAEVSDDRRHSVSRERSPCWCGAQFIGGSFDDKLPTKHRCRALSLLHAERHATNGGGIRGVSLPVRGLEYTERDATDLVGALTLRRCVANCARHECNQDNQGPRTYRNHECDHRNGFAITHCSEQQNLGALSYAELSAELHDMCIEAHQMQK